MGEKTFSTNARKVAEAQQASDAIDNLRDRQQETRDRARRTRGDQDPDEVIAQGDIIQLDPIVDHNIRGSGGVNMS